MAEPASVALIPDVNAALAPDRDAIIDGDRRVTHAQLLERCVAVAAGLAAHGLRKGDRLALLLQNRMEFLEVFYAAARSGLILVPLNYRLSGRELRLILADSSPKAIIAERGYGNVLRSILPSVPTVEKIIWVGDPPAEGLPYEELLAVTPRTSTASPLGQDLIALLFTGGTTGRPKGVMVTQDALTISVKSQSESFGFATSDISLCVVPLFHVSIVHYLSIAWAGATAVLMSKVEPEAVLDAIERYRVTHTNLIPTTIGDLLADPTIAERDLSSLRIVSYGGAPIPIDMLRATLDRVGPVLHQSYGLTEISGVATVLWPGDHRLDDVDLLGSVGLPLPHVTAEIRSADGAVAPDGVVGELALRGPSVMQGYWNNPEETRKALIDGVLRTGDLAHIENGYVYLHGRSKEMIISGGENIYPAEVENVIYEHPDVLEAAVIGVPDERWGESVKAFVVARPGSDLSPSQLIAHCRRSLAGYKVPKEIAIRDFLPRTSVGKIYKPALLRAELEATAGITPER
jgi:acyl-CoA synthetase (AMP-forming)/AMP-acid ligase II